MRFEDGTRLFPGWGLLMVACSQYTKVKGPMGRHSKVRHRTRQLVWKGLVEMVDARTGENHLVTLDAAAAARRAPHRCHAQCGAVVTPAALVDPGTGHYCGPCRSSTTPAPRAGT